MDNKKTKSRFNEPVYSSTYDNGGWSERDKLPESDPIGDVDESDKYKIARTGVGQYHIDFSDCNFYKNMKKHCISPKNKYDGSRFPDIDMDSKTCCSSPAKYINGIGSLKFYSCKNCGADLGDC